MEPISKLHQSLRFIGQQEKLRSRVLAWCKEVESLASYPQGSIREEVTGPLLDAVYSGGHIFRKQLANGLIFDFYYRTKIARDFLMSEPEVPSHVWEPQTTKLLLHLAANCRDVLVGGAYFGDQALLLAHKMRRNNSTVHAFEPNSDQFNMLRHNARINGITNLKAWRMGLWKESGGSLRLVGEDSFAHAESAAAAADSQDSDAFPTVAIDDYVREHNIGKLDLIMLDIEGLEQAVLQGAKGQLSLPPDEAPVIIYEVHRSYVDWSEGLDRSGIVQELKDLGYSSYAVRDYNSNVDMTGMPIEIIPPDSVYLEGPPHGFNMLAVKDTSILESSAFRLCRDVSPKLLQHSSSYLHQPTQR
jgi:FkbM family methyltransferase